jgi:hypothetical protein
MPCPGQASLPPAQAVQAAVTAFVAAAKKAGEDVNRYTVEMALKKAVRHPESEVA